MAGDADGHVYARGIASRKLSARLSDHPAPGPGPSYVLGQRPEGVTSLSVDDDGALLAVGDGDGRIYLWDLTGRRVIARPGKSLAPYHSQVSAAFSPGGGTLAARLADDTVVVWSAATGKPLAVESGPPAQQPNWLDNDPVDEVAFSPDGALLATSDDNGVTIWKVTS
jgi:WD40 repeat protein